MKPIVAQDQVRLGALRCFQLARTGMGYRLFRSSVTVAILSLAVAFLTHTLVYGIVESATRVAAGRELEHARRLGQVITRLGTPDTRAAILAGLDASEPARVAEYRRWSGASAERFERALAAAGALRSFDAFTRSLAPAARAALVADYTSETLIESLSEPAKFRHFMEQLAQFGLAAPLGDAARFERLVRVERPLLDGVVADIQRGQRAAIARVRAQFPGKTPEELSAEPPPGLRQALAEAGYDVSGFELDELSAFARRERDLGGLGKGILSGETRAALARLCDLPPGEVALASVLACVGSNESRAEALSRALRGSPGAQLGAPRILELSRRQARALELERAAPEPGVSNDVTGGSARSRWLLVLSFLVCAVGVANAMLMSVTERFTEIATMKCLGALDGFVMLMFVFEALIQGAIGGVIGILIGSLLALLRVLLEYGGLVLDAARSLSGVPLALAASLVAGMVLATLAAVGPAFLAARLAPMEAMRVD